MPISKYNQIRPHRLRDANCLLPIRGLATHFKISFTREDLGEDLSDKAIVVNDQNTAAVRLSLGRRVVSRLRQRAAQDEPPSCTLGKSQLAVYESADLERELSYNSANNSAK